MCGIVGLLSPASSAAALQAALSPLLDAIRHRGPDDGGLHAEPGVALGMRRLSLIDLEGGRQPMASEDGQCVLVYNGEVYNFRELRQELEAKGHRFRTRSDTEVVLEGYRAWGEGVTERLNGIFAFALYDRGRRRLLLARDPMGVKPLYLARGEDWLAFCSEPAPLYPLLPRQIDPEGLSLFLAHKYLPAPRTLVKGLEKLPPASRLSVEVDHPQEERTPEIYWRIDRPAPWESLPPPPADEEQALEQLSGLLRAAVARQLIADAPVGLFLSGGVDSGLMLWAALREGADPLAFTAGFADPRFDETRESAETAAFLGARRHVHPLDAPSPEDLGGWVERFGEPFANISIPAQFAICRAAAAYGKAALGGTGGDELFGGYDRYYAASPPAALRWAERLAPWAKPLARPLPARQGSRLARAKVWMETAGLTPERRYARAVRLFSEEALARLIPAFSPRPDAVAAAFALAPGNDDLQRATWTDMATMLPEDYLLLIDRTGMAESLEVRAPLLDLPLVRWAWGLESRWKIRGWRKKYLLRRLAARVLPPGAADRRKRGFEAPVGGWYRGELGESLLDALGSGQTLGIDRREVESLLQRHRRGVEDGTKGLLAVHTLALWADQRGLSL